MKAIRKLLPRHSVRATIPPFLLHSNSARLHSWAFFFCLIRLGLELLYGVIENLHCAPAPIIECSVDFVPCEVTGILNHHARQTFVKDEPVLELIRGWFVFMPRKPRCLE